MGGNENRVFQELFRYKAFGNIVGKQIKNLSARLCQREYSGGEVIPVAVTGKDVERFFQRRFWNAPLVIIEQQAAVIQFRQKRAVLNKGNFHHVSPPCRDRLSLWAAFVISASKNVGKPFSVLNTAGFVGFFRNCLKTHFAGRAAD